MNWNYLLGCFLILISCKEKPVEPTQSSSKTIKIESELVYNEKVLKPNDTIVFSNGFKLVLAECKWLMTDVQIDGGDKRNVFLDWSQSKLVWGEFPYTSTPNSIGFKVGVAEYLNHADPSKFPSNDPLNIYNAGDMHWSWKPGYIFIKLEGKLDTIPSNPFNADMLFSYHVGTDSCIRSKALQLKTITTNNTGNLSSKFKIDLVRFFESKTNPIVWSKENITHSSESQIDLSNKIANLFLECWLDQ